MEKAEQKGVIDMNIRKVKRKWSSYNNTWKKNIKNRNGRICCHIVNTI